MDASRQGVGGGGGNDEWMMRLIHAVRLNPQLLASEQLAEQVAPFPELVNQLRIAAASGIQAQQVQQQQAQQQQLQQQQQQQMLLNAQQQQLNLPANLIMALNNAQQQAQQGRLVGTPAPLPQPPQQQSPAPQASGLQFSPQQYLMLQQMVSQAQAQQQQQQQAQQAQQQYAALAQQMGLLQNAGLPQSINLAQLQQAQQQSQGGMNALQMAIASLQPLSNLSNQTLLDQLVMQHQMRSQQQQQQQQQQSIMEQIQMQALQQQEQEQARLRAEQEQARARAEERARLEAVRLQQEQLVRAQEQARLQAAQQKAQMDALARARDAFQAQQLAAAQSALHNPMSSPVPTIGAVLPVVQQSREADQHGPHSLSHSMTQQQIMAFTQKAENTRRANEAARVQQMQAMLQQKQRQQKNVLSVHPSVSIAQHPAPQNERRVGGERMFEVNTKYLRILIAMARGGPNAPFVRSVTATPEEIKAFTSKLQQQQDEQHTDKVVLDAMAKLQGRTTALRAFCIQLFPRSTLAVVLQHLPSEWSLSIPTDVDVVSVRMLAATLEYKKKLTEVKTLYDWLENFINTAQPQSFSSEFQRVFPSHTTAVSLIEKAIENVSSEWAEARMRLVDHFSQGMLGVDKIMLPPAAARILTNEVDKLCVMEPIQPAELSVANGKFIPALGMSPPHWVPFTDADMRPHHVAPSTLSTAQKPSTSLLAASSSAYDRPGTSRQILTAAAAVSSTISTPNSSIAEPKRRSPTTTALPRKRVRIQTPTEQVLLPLPPVTTPSEPGDHSTEETPQPSHSSTADAAPSTSASRKDGEESTVQTDELSGTVLEGFVQCESLYEELTVAEIKKQHFIKETCALIVRKIEVKRQLELMRFRGARDHVGATSVQDVIVECEKQLADLCGGIHAMEEKTRKLTSRIAQIKKVQTSGNVDIEKIISEIAESDRQRMEQLIQLGQLKNSSQPTTIDGTEITPPPDSELPPSFATPDLSHSLALVEERAAAVDLPPPPPKQRNVLLEIVEKMKEDHRFANLNMKFRSEIALAQLYVKGTKEGNGELKPENITRELVSSLIGPSAPNLDEFVKSLQNIAECVNKDSDVQERMTKILHELEKTANGGEFPKDFLLESSSASSSTTTVSSPIVATSSESREVPSSSQDEQPSSSTSWDLPTTSSSSSSTSKEKPCCSKALNE